MAEKTEKKGLGATVIQFIKFGLVGVSNTAISYGIDQLFYYVVFRDSAMDEKLKITSPRKAFSKRATLPAA